MLKNGVGLRYESQTDCLQHLYTGYHGGKKLLPRCTWSRTIDSKGNVIRLVTNRFDLSAEEIGDIYRSRWAIELFFKWLKQHVRIKTFFGTSEEAIQNQIFMALIAYCLLVLVQMETKAKQSILQLKRWLKSFLWKSYEKWFHRIQFRSMRRKRKLST